MIPAVICDPGTGYMKMGFAGDDFPRSSFASLVGRPMLRTEEIVGDNIQLKEVMIGNEASKNRAFLELSYPTSEGIVKNWDDMGLLMDYSFKMIATNPRDSSVFVTQAIMNPVANKKRMLELMFQKMQIGRIQFGMQALMSLYAQGLDTALLLDCGDGVSHCIPVFQGNMLKNGFERLEIAGRHVTTFLLKLLQMRGYALNSTSDFETVREIKEKHCFVSGDIKVDKKLALETCTHDKTYDLPDGHKITIGKERFLAGEILMNPSIAGFELEGCGEMVFRSISKCDMTLKKSFYESILISGGTSMLPGFSSRLKGEVEKCFKQKVTKGGTSSLIKIKVIDAPTRKYNVFKGASIVAQQSTSYQEMWKTKAQYQEKGMERLAQELSAR